MDEHDPNHKHDPNHTASQHATGNGERTHDELSLDSREKSQLNDLLSSLCDGMLDQAGAEQLHELLRRSKEARSTYIQYLHMHASVAYAQAPPGHLELGATGLGTADLGNAGSDNRADSFESQPWPAARPTAWKILASSLVRPLSTISKRSSSRIAVSAAAILACIVGGLFIFSSGDNARAPFGRSRVKYAARVVQQDDCRWGDGTVSSVQGGLLHNEDELNLLEGLAKLRFDCGAEIVMRGPAKLRIDSGMNCFLASGELSAKVPEVAIGFTVDTPLGQVVDLGTAFGVNVDEEIEVQVFEGELELHPERHASQHAMKEQQALERQQATMGKEPAAIGMTAGAARKMLVDEESSLVRVQEISEPLHQFSRSLSQLKEDLPASRLSALAVDSFGQGSPGTRLTGRNGGFGWDGPWINTPDSNSVSFLLGSDGAISRGSGDGVVERRLGPGLASAEVLYFSAEFQIDGPDERCSAWLELFKFKPFHWSNGDGNLAVVGITDGQFSGRLAPFGIPEVEQSIGDCGRYAKGTRHLIVGKLEMNAVGDQERLSIWINPALADETTPNKVIIRDTGQPGADAIAIRCWEMDDRTVATLSEVRASQNWMDVVQ